MKNCEQIAPLLSAYVDGELTEEERAEVLAHLDACETCRARLEEWMAMHAAFDAWEEADVPEGFAAGVMDAVHAEKAAAKPRAGSRRRVRRWLSLAACAAVALLTAVTLPYLRPEKAAEDETASGNAAQQEMTFAATADDDRMLKPEEEEYPEQRCETVQSSPYYSMTSGAAEDGPLMDNGMAKSAESDEAEYGYESLALGLSGETGNVLTNGYGTVLLVLCGPGTVDYVVENGGVADGGSGDYFVPIEALRSLPESLALEGLSAEALSLAPEEAEWALVYPADGGEVQP